MPLFPSISLASQLGAPAHFDLRGKNALITGGSRGLGLEIARVLLARGARVALVARDPRELERALDALQRTVPSYAARVSVHACDLCDPAAITPMLEAARAGLGTIDVLVNNAGTIQVGPLASMTLDDFDRAMKLHYEAPLRSSLWLRDHLRERGAPGRVANIASIGGIIAVPHLLPYSASKFALMGLSQGLRTELARDDIYVTTIAPGLMRTGSPRRALFKGDHAKEYAWFKISDSLPLLSVSARRAAKQIVAAIERGDAHLVIGLAAKLGAMAAGVAPHALSRVLTLANALLPSGTDPETRQGFESESALTRGRLSTLTDRAAVRNNEL